MSQTEVPMSKSALALTKMGEPAKVVLSDKRRVPLFSDGVGALGVGEEHPIQFSRANKPVNKR